LIAINPGWLQTSGGDQAIHNDTTVTGGGARAICLWALAALFSPFIFPSFKRNKGEKGKNKNKNTIDISMFF
jgi:hypothetical protein